MRTHYFSCSKFADKIRGAIQPKSGTAKEWTSWRKQAKTAHKFRYWLADDGLDAIQNFIYWPYDTWDSIRCYVRNRWFDKTNSLTAHKKHLKPGEWCDLGNRFIPCLFDELVDYVEQELAWMHIAFDPEKKRELPFWKRLKTFRFSSWRNIDAGLANLEWQISLIHDESSGVLPNDKLYGKPTQQAISAKEIKNLYLWYTVTYCNRPDPYDASGWSDYCDKNRELTTDAETLAFLDNEGESKEMKNMCDKSLNLLRKIEKQYDAEDTKMLVRLMKIRQNLWT